MRAYSQDIRVRVIEAYQKGEGSQRQIARRFRVSLSFVANLMNQFRKTGSAALKPHRGGCPPKIDEQGLKTLRRLAEESPNATLDVLCARFAEECQINLSRATMSRALNKIKVRHKSYRQETICKAQVRTGRGMAKQSNELTHRT